MEGEEELQFSQNGWNQGENGPYEHTDTQMNFPWMCHVSHTLAEDFPRAPISIPFEGFVPAHGSSLLHDHDATELNVPSSNLHYGLGHQPIPNYDNEQHSTSGLQLETDTTTNYNGMSDLTSGVADYSHLHHLPTYGQQFDRDNWNNPPRHATLVRDQHFEAPDIADAEDTAEGGSQPPQSKKRGRPSKTQSGRSRKRRKGQRGGWSKGVAIGPRAAVEPSEDFRRLHGEALAAFMREDYEQSQISILKAIAINPEVFPAHSLLAQIHFRRDDPKAAVDALFLGAHHNPSDVEQWRQIADTVLTKGGNDRQRMLDQASYCYSMILRKDSKDFDARFQRAICRRELGQYAKALNDLDIVVKEHPHNSDLLSNVAEICLEIGDCAKAIELYEDTFEYFRETGLEEGHSFTWQDVVLYTDLLAAKNDNLRAIDALRQLCRWLVGREDEDFWDDFVEDDREWDRDHFPRRIQVDGFQVGQHPRDSYGEGMPLTLRVKLGVLRLKLNFRTEALKHFDWLSSEDLTSEGVVRENHDLILEAANALLQAKENAKALRFYETLLEAEAHDGGVGFWLGIAASSYAVGKKPESVDFYEKAKSADNSCIEARAQLSRLYADRGDRPQALRNAREAVILAQNAIPQSNRRKYERKEQRLVREGAERALKDAYRMPAAPGARPGRIPQELRNQRRAFRRLPIPVEVKNMEKIRTIKPPKTPKPRRRVTKSENAIKHYEEVQMLYQTLCDAQTEMREGDEMARNTWMDCAQALIEDFRTVKSFYPGERHFKFHGYVGSSVRTRAEYERATGRQSDTTESAGRNSVDNADTDNVMRSPEPSVPDDFCGITFARWLDIFLEYALLLVTSSSLTVMTQEECYTVITAAIDCTIFYHNPEHLMQTYICYLVCALTLGDEATVFNTVLRWFMREFAFCSDAYRLFSAINLVYDYPAHQQGKAGQLSQAVFRNGKNQKFLFRQIGSIDNLLPEDYNADGTEGPVPAFMRKDRDELRKVSNGNYLRRKKKSVSFAADNDNEDGEDNDDNTNNNNTSGNYRYNEDDDEDGADGQSTKMVRPQEMDVVLLTLYGHVMMSNASFPNALSYLYRAYTIDPDNPLVLLSIALSYMHQLLKRQNENRHMYMLQGWAWFERYATARCRWAERKEQQEKNDDNDDDDDEEKEKKRNADSRSVGAGREGNEGEEQGRGRRSLTLLVKREIEFNRARGWAMLGMADLAMRTYEKALRLPLTPSDDDASCGVPDRDNEGWTMEAAYAMATTYALSGNARRAKEITEQYLVVE